MKKALLLPLALLCALVHAQEPPMLGEKDVSPATRAYHEFRQASTEPPFGLARVKALIKAIKPTKGEEGDIEAVSDAVWNRMTVAERFTYCMLHPEEPSQNCDMMPWVVDEERKVFAYPPAPYGGERTMSARQEAFLKKNRAAVVGLLRDTIRAKGRVGTNLKWTVTELDAVELIPDLLAAYRKDARDGDILSVLMILMKEGKYKPFLESATYHKLYGEDASYQAFLVANAANRKLMEERAMGFYRTRVK